MNRIPVATFSNCAQAEPLRKRLVDSGFQAEIHDELKLEKLWFVSKPGTCARLEVPAEQFERAYQLLLDWDAAEGALRDAIHCPQCKSLRVQYPAHTRRSLIPNMVMGLLAAIGQVNKEYYCEDCHYTWPKEGQKPSAVRPHLAPDYFIEGAEKTSLPPQPAQAPVEDHRRAA